MLFLDDATRENGCLEVIPGAPLLVHRSAPNRSASERRALLFSYQPPGRRNQLDNLRQRKPRSA